MMRFMGPGIRQSSSFVVDIVVFARLSSYVLNVIHVFLISDRFKCVSGFVSKLVSTPHAQRLVCCQNFAYTS